MRGDEARIVKAFCEYLTARGWQVQAEVEFTDVYATKDGERLYAEAKGRTAAPGLDIDTLYGQLLRRMPAEEVGRARFAVVVPDNAARFVRRVPTRVRELLSIDLYAVTEDNRVIKEN